MLREYNIVVKDPRRVDVRVAAAYPNLYKIAMSSLGYHVIYHFLNSREDVWCERVIHPYRGSFESLTPLDSFDIVSFTIHYEQDYFNVLEMLHRGGVELKRDERGGGPFLVAGGPCVTANPLPMSDFIDLFIIGEAEKVLDDVIDTFLGLDDPRGDIDEFMDIEGVYVPDNPSRRVIVEDMDDACHPVYQIVAESDDQNFIPALGRSFLLGVSRGCTRGCRFCMSGYLYRPKRETSLKRLFKVSERGKIATGFDRISLIGAAVSDYSRIDELCQGLLERGFRVTMPSLRIESVTGTLLDTLAESGVKTITLAPESTWEIRKRLNKPIMDDMIFKVVRMALERGLDIKMYFLVGSPFETIKDIKGLAEFMGDILRLSPRKGAIRFSINPLVPKPHTPLQWEAFNFDAIRDKLRFLRSEIKRAPIKIESPRMALIQHVLSTGGPEVSELIEKAWMGNATLRDWKLKSKPRVPGEKLPWENIDIGLKDDFIIEEYQRMKDDKLTPYCEVDSCYKCLKDTCKGGI